MKDRYIHIRQINGWDCWINPSQIIRISKHGEMQYDIVMGDHQIVSVSTMCPENKELFAYLDLDRREVL